MDIAPTLKNKENKDQHQLLQILSDDTYATFHGSGPRTLRYVRGFIVPAPTWKTQGAKRL